MTTRGIAHAAGLALITTLVVTVIHAGGPGGPGWLVDRGSPHELRM